MKGVRDDGTIDFGEAYSAMNENAARMAELGRGVKALYKASKQLLFVVTVLLSMPADVIMHRRFGVRVITLPYIVVTASMVYFGGRLVLSPDEYGLLNIVTTAFTLLAIAHFVEANWRFNRGEQWYTRCSGVPYGFWGRLRGGESPMTVMRFYEPVTLIIAGAFALAVTQLGLLLIAIGIAQFMHGYLEYREIRTQVLDQRDAEIEARSMQLLVKGERNDWENTGYIVPPVEAFGLVAGGTQAEGELSADEALARVDQMLDKPEVEVVTKRPTDSRETAS